jgi:hypothetical protein
VSGFSKGLTPRVSLARKGIINRRLTHTALTGSELP